MQVITLTKEELRDVIAQAVALALERHEAMHAKLNGQLAFKESTAAALLDTKPHILRDARLRGELVGSRIGKRIHYTREAIVEFVARGAG